MNENVLKIWTDNGRVDSGEYNMSSYCIRPIKLICYELFGNE